MSKISFKNDNYYIYYEIADSNEELRRCITNNGVFATHDISDDRFDGYLAVPLRNIDEDPCDKTLSDYLAKYKKWRYSARLNKVYGVDFSVGEVSACQRLFFQLIRNYKQNAPIDRIEYFWMEKCANNALMYLKEDNIEAECTSYDRKMCYGNILGSDIKIPTQPGCEFTLDQLPIECDLMCGYYRVKITTEDKDFYKCFTFSKDNVYVDLSLKFAMKHKEKFNVKFELILDDKPNAYIYNEDDVISLNSMTSLWHEKVSALKAQYKSNGLIKFLASGTWGAIQQRNTRYYTYEEIQKKNKKKKWSIGVSEDDTHTILDMKTVKDVEYYRVVNTNKAYHFNLRLKPFETAQARNDLATLARKHLKHIIRIQTDSISFNKPLDINDTNYALEDKTTGLIHWDNVNSYHNKTNGYKSKTYKL
jgi:hypothetical protein